VQPGNRRGLGCAGHDLWRRLGRPAQGAEVAETAQRLQIRDADGNRLDRLGLEEDALGDTRHHQRKDDE